MRPASPSCSATSGRSPTRRGSSAPPPDDLVGGVQRKLDELRALADEVKVLRAKLATGRAGELAATATDGAVVQRVDGLAPGDLRDLAIAVRNEPGVDVVVLAGETPTGGVSLVAAVRPGLGVEAAALLRDAAKAVGGGGGGKGDIATAGGKDPGRPRRRPAHRRRRRRRRAHLTVRALGLDLGSKRIGVAVSDVIGHDRLTADRRRARPARAVTTTSGSPPSCATRRPSCVVVGMPLSLSGQDGPAARAARKEVAALATVVGVPVETYDERFTTVTAERALADSGVRGAARRAGRRQGRGRRDPAVVARRPPRERRP